MTQPSDLLNQIEQWARERTRNGGRICMKCVYDLRRMTEEDDRQFREMETKE